MLTRVQALLAILALTATASIAAPKVPPKPAAKPGPLRCDVKINQPAASVHLNRTKAPPSVCVLGCDAKLVGVRKENGQIAALAIYTGRRCLPAGSSKAKPAPGPSPKPDGKAPSAPKAKPAAPSEVIARTDTSAAPARPKPRPVSPAAKPAAVKPATP